MKHNKIRDCKKSLHLYSPKVGNVGNTVSIVPVGDHINTQKYYQKNNCNNSIIVMNQASEEPKHNLI